MRRSVSVTKETCSRGLNPKDSTIKITIIIKNGQVIDLVFCGCNCCTSLFNLELTAHRVFIKQIKSF